MYGTLIRPVNKTHGKTEFWQTNMTASADGRISDVVGCGYALRPYITPVVINPFSTGARVPFIKNELEAKSDSIEMASFNIVDTDEAHELYPILSHVDYKSTEDTMSGCVADDTVNDRIVDGKNIPWEQRIPPPHVRCAETSSTGIRDLYNQFCASRVKNEGLSPSAQDLAPPSFARKVTEELDLPISAAPPHDAQAEGSNIPKRTSLHIPLLPAIELINLKEYNLTSALIEKREIGSKQAEVKDSKLIPSKVESGEKRNKFSSRKRKLPTRFLNKNLSNANKKHQPEKECQLNLMSNKHVNRSMDQKKTNPSLSKGPRLIHLSTKDKLSHAFQNQKSTKVLKYVTPPPTVAALGSFAEKFKYHEQSIWRELEMWGDVPNKGAIFDSLRSALLENMSDSFRSDCR